MTSVVTIRPRKNPGQSLVEVIVAVGMMALLLTAVLALISLSVKNSRLAKDRTKAVGFAQEGVELIRTYRDLSWTELLAKAGSEYDLAKGWTVESSLSAICPETNNIDDFFKRCVRITDTGSNTATVIVTVSWQEGSQRYNAVQQTSLSLWER
ncbi:MAG: hypothetical protein V1810_03185 [Candidatus Beckwithbacteria bacterium]